jgi:hypothetical protein
MVKFLVLLESAHYTRVCVNCAEKDPSVRGHPLSSTSILTVQLLYFS